LAKHAEFYGLNQRLLKKGTNYIDPLWLSWASERACNNLDFNMIIAEEALYMLTHYV